MEQLETILIMSDLLAASAQNDAEKVKTHFKLLVEASGYKWKGKELDLNAISVQAANLLKAIANGEEDIKSSLETIGARLGFSVVNSEELEEGNSLPA